MDCDRWLNTGFYGDASLAAIYALTPPRLHTAKVTGSIPVNPEQASKVQSWTPTPP